MVSSICIEYKKFTQLYSIKYSYLKDIIQVVGLFYSMPTLSRLFYVTVSLTFMVIVTIAMF